MLLFGAAYLGVRRAMEKDQRRPRQSTVPLWQLLGGEIALMARRIGRWKVTAATAIAFACFLAVEVALSSATPGPALAEAWRWLVAAILTALALCAWAAVHAMRAARPSGEPASPVERSRLS